MTWISYIVAMTRCMMIPLSTWIPQFGCIWPG